MVLQVSIPSSKKKFLFGTIKVVEFNPLNEKR